MSADGPRVMRLNERQDLIDHVNRVMREEVGSDPTYGEDWPHVHQPENVPNIFVVREDDQIVASTAIYPHDTRLGDVDVADRRDQRGVDRRAVSPPRLRDAGAGCLHRAHGGAG